jgi:CRP-like cAMP-binding protein
MSVYPDAPGHQGTDTSIAAADSIADSLGRLQAMSLAAIREASLSVPVGLTAEELAARLNMPRETVQPRTSELRRKGKIVDSDIRRRNASGKAAIVWVVTERRTDG